ncbi:hypothetical protein F5887DRAFT_917897 [Amanita rubescens]|nr:hypothetical protein F5887DRAFT_917897 [Amanita rubescens]
MDFAYGDFEVQRLKCRLSEVQASLELDVTSAQRASGFRRAFQIWKGRPAITMRRGAPIDWSSSNDTVTATRAIWIPSARRRSEENEREEEERLVLGRMGDSLDTSEDRIPRVFQQEGNGAGIARGLFSMDSERRLISIIREPEAADEIDREVDGLDGRTNTGPQECFQGLDEMSASSNKGSRVQEKGIETTSRYGIPEYANVQ